MHDQPVANSYQGQESGAYVPKGHVKGGETLNLDSNGYICRWNARLQNLVTYSAEEVIGQHFSCLWPVEELEQGKPTQSLTLATTHDHFVEEGWRIRKNGSRFWASVTLT